MRNGNASKIVFPFANVCTNIYCKCSGFVVLVSSRKSQKTCEGCRKALQRYRNSGKTFHHVSVFPKFTFFNLTYTYDVEIVDSVVLSIKILLKSRNVSLK